jgi:hypothetical protein
MVRVEHHPDSRSRALWSTAFGASGQGELFGDVVSVVNAWVVSGFSIKVGAGDYT